MKGSYLGENIIKAVIPIIRGIGIKQSQLGYFIGDNASPNNTAVRVILAELYSTLRNPNFRRIRYLGYIINLVIKVFLFGKDADAFEEDSKTKKKLLKLEAVRDLWRKKGLLGKFYNTVSFIRRTPQRRETFLTIYRKEIEKNIEGKTLNYFKY